MSPVDLYDQTNFPFLRLSIYKMLSELPTKTWLFQYTGSEKIAASVSKDHNGFGGIPATGFETVLAQMTDEKTRGKITETDFFIPEN